MNNIKIILASILSIGSLGMCSCDNSVKIGPQPTPDPVAPEGTDVKMITTTTNRSKDLTVSGIAFSTKDNMSPTCITLLPEEEYQTMDGFGVAVTGSTCYNLLKMNPEDRKAFLEVTFDPKNGYGFSYVRISIGCSDFSLSEYTCCDQEGIDNFALTKEKPTMSSRFSRKFSPSTRR